MSKIPLSILAKPGRLDPAEEVQMRTHPEWGLFLIRSGQGTIGETAARIALAHHERWDGTGYPLRTARREIRFDLRARSFLHNQVRSLVGTLERVGAGAWTPGRVAEALAARDRAACGPVAPPHGLWLTGVSYPGPRAPAFPERG